MQKNRIICNYTPIYLHEPRLHLQSKTVKKFSRFSLQCAKGYQFITTIHKILYTKSPQKWHLNRSIYIGLQSAYTFNRKTVGSRHDNTTAGHYQELPLHFWSPS